MVLGQRELDLRAGDAVDLADRLGDLALERALIGDLLLEGGGAELLLVEQLEAGLRAPPVRPFAASATWALDSLPLTTASAVPLFSARKGRPLSSAAVILPVWAGSRPAWTVV